MDRVDARSHKWRCPGAYRCRRAVQGGHTSVTSRRRAEVVLQEAAEPRAALDFAIVCRRRRAAEELIPQPMFRPLLALMLEVPVFTPPFQVAQHRPIDIRHLPSLDAGRAMTALSVRSLFFRARARPVNRRSQKFANGCVRSAPTEQNSNFVIPLAAISSEFALSRQSS